MTPNGSALKGFLLEYPALSIRILSKRVRMKMFEDPICLEVSYACVSKFYVVHVT